MVGNWQTVRVFISSTFKDMHAERDWLVKRVFPALRERLAPYWVHLVDIDLRWGVTEQQAENGGALDVCLEQIDACRPFFLGLLGERYGWMPDAIPDRVTRNSKWGWIRDTGRRSITEMEILYGVLNNPEMRGHAFFCFRDPAFLKDVPEAKLKDMTVESEEAKERLRNLKQRIRDSGLPRFEPYPCTYAGLRVNWRLARQAVKSDEYRKALALVAADGLVKPDEYQQLETEQPHLKQIVDESSVVALANLEEFGTRVLEWLWAAIQEELKLPEKPPALLASERDPLAEEQDYHERFLENRTRVYIGREKLQESLVAFANGTDETPCLVTGPSGSGKSAALARFAAEFTSQNPGVFVILHFVGASAASTSLRSMLHRFCKMLKQRLNLTDDVPQDTNGLITTFRQFLEKIPAGRRVIIVIDALNQLDEADSAQRLTWLPWKFPGHVKLICSCIADPDRHEPVLDAFATRAHQLIPVEALTGIERQAILEQVPSLSAKTLDARQVRALLDNPATANPLFLLVALEELRGFGSYEQLNQRIEEFPRDGDAVTMLFRQVIERLEWEFDAKVVRSLLTLLASARRGLSDRELLDQLEGPGVAIQQSASDLFPVQRQLRAYLQYRGALWDFFHRNLYKAVREHYLPNAELQSAAHARLAQYFAGQAYFLESLDDQRARAKRLPPTPRPANVRKVDELPFQLLQVAKLSGKDDPKSPHWDAIADFFTDIHFLEAKAEAVA